MFFTANGIIKSDTVANAMTSVDRKHYCPYAPYHDSPQSIGYSATISAPHMVNNFQLTNCIIWWTKLQTINNIYIFTLDPIHCMQRDRAPYVTVFVDLPCFLHIHSIHAYTTFTWSPDQFDHGMSSLVF